MREREKSQGRKPVSEAQDDSVGGWRISSHSYGSGACVEVAALFGEGIQVRDSKNPQGPVLQISQVGWAAFLSRTRRDPRVKIIRHTRTTRTNSA